MDLKNFLKKTFGKDLFSVSEDDLFKERLRIEKSVESISDDIRGVQDKVQKLLIESKGQPRTLKLLNVQKIKALRLESNTMQQEASRKLHLMQLILLVETMRERQKTKEKSKVVEHLLNTDVSELNKVLTDMDVMKALEEGKIDKVKDKLERIFGKEDIALDEESQDILKAIGDLESVDQETAIEKAREESKELTEQPVKKEEKLVEE